MTTDNTAGTAITAPTTPTGLTVAPLGAMFDSSPTRIFTSVDTSTEFGRALTMVMMQSGTALPLSDHLNTPIAVQDFIVHTVNFTDDDGVEVVADRIVLITPDGTAYAAVSNAVRRSLQMLMVMFGVPPYKPAKLIKAVGVKTRRKFTAITLVPVMEALRPVGVEVEPPTQPTQKKK